MKMVKNNSDKDFLALFSFPQGVGRRTKRKREKAVMKKREKLSSA